MNIRNLQVGLWVRSGGAAGVTGGPGESFGRAPAHSILCICSEGSPACLVPPPQKVAGLPWKFIPAEMIGVSAWRVRVSEM